MVGVDFNTGTFTHSFRYSYLKFQNQIVDATLNNSALPYCCTGSGISSAPFYVGPNLLAPQSTPQANNQVKYDGSKVLHSHTLRYGVAYNHIQGGGFASFYGTAPRASFTESVTIAVLPRRLLPRFANTGPFPGGTANPLNWP